MPAEFLKCVKDLKAQGKSDDSAYAICVASYQKANGGKSPFKNEEVDTLPVSDVAKGNIKKMIEQVESGKKIKVIGEKTRQA